MGKVFDSKLFERSVIVCALVDDLAQFQDGDETMIGDRGITLSGG